MVDWGLPLLHTPLCHWPEPWPQGLEEPVSCACSISDQFLILASWCYHWPSYLLAKHQTELFNSSKTLPLVGSSAPDSALSQDRETGNGFTLWPENNHPKKSRHTFSSAPRAFTKTDHIPGHETSLNELKKIQVIHTMFSDHKGITLEICNRFVS